METLDLLIIKFKEFKEELMAKNNEMLEKKSTEIVKPRLTGLDRIKAESQKPIQSMDAKATKSPRLTGLDRVRAESQKPIESMDAKVKKDEGMDKGADLKAKEVGSHIAADAYKGFLNKPQLPKPHKNSMPSPEEHAARASMYEDFAPSPVRKNVNNSYADDPNSGMAMSRSEKISLSKNGQWNLGKSEVDYASVSHGKYTHHNNADPAKNVPATEHHVSYNRWNTTPQSFGPFKSEKHAQDFVNEHHAKQMADTKVPKLNAKEYEYHKSENDSD